MDSPKLHGWVAHRIGGVHLKELSPTQELQALYQPKHKPLEVVWHDEWLIAINKPHNELSVPGKPPLDQWATLLRVQDHFGDAKVVHRLDGATSGVILFARNGWAQRQMHHAFRQRFIKKTYCALVSGEVKNPIGTIDLPLNRDWYNRPKQKIDFFEGKPSLTHWARAAIDSTKNMSRLKITPITGRSHQIRVHLKALGHPILGDRLYHPDFEASTKKRLLLSRLHLHAMTLKFYHPITAKYITLQAPCPF